MAATEQISLVDFELDDVPTFPGRLPSGGVVRGELIRSMEPQYEAEKECNLALDRLIKALRQVARSGPFDTRYSLQHPRRDH